MKEDMKNEKCKNKNTAVCRIWDYFPADSDIGCDELPAFGRYGYWG